MGLYFAKLIGKPVYIYAQSIGPFNTKLNKLVKEVLNKLNLIILRDKISYDLLKKIGIKEDLMKVTADAAFMMDLNKGMEFASKSLEKIEFINLKEKKLKISISIREWRHTGDHKKFIKNIAEVCNKLIIKYDANIYFASTCTGFGGYHTDDRIPALDAIEFIDKKENVKVLMGEYTPQELYYFYSKMDLHIGTRMHSNILSMLSKTPIVPIQYEFKTKALMDYFEINDIIEIEKFEVNESFKIIEKAITERKIISIKISEKLSMIKKRSHKTAQLIKSNFQNNT